MKILGFEIRKFEENPTTIKIVETWNVRWYSVEQSKSAIDKKTRYTPDEKENVQGFPTKDDAKAYAKELIDARRLLGDIYDDPKIELMKTPTNV